MGTPKPRLNGRFWKHFWQRIFPTKASDNCGPNDCANLAGTGSQRKLIEKVEQLEVFHWKNWLRKNWKDWIWRKVNLKGLNSNESYWKQKNRSKRQGHVMGREIDCRTVQWTVSINYYGERTIYLLWLISHLENVKTKRWKIIFFAPSYGRL